MKRSLFFFSIGFLVLSLSFLNLVVTAKEDNCPADDWTVLAVEIHNQYPDILAGEPSESLEQVAQLQHLRRCLDEAARLDENDEAYALLHEALDLAVDSIVIGLLGDDEIAEDLLNRANTQHLEAGLIIFPGPIEEVAVDMDTSDDGSVVDSPYSISGTYTASLLDEENPFWIFVVASDSKVYPQAHDACSNVDRKPIPYSPFANTWRMEIGLGQSHNTNHEFQIILVQVNSEKNEFLNQKFQEWCNANDFVGLQFAQVDPANGDVTVIEFMTVTRGN